MRSKLLHLVMALALPAATALAFVAVPVPTVADDPCYEDGTAYSPGALVCMDGWVMVCTQSGWALLGSGTSC